MSLPAGHGWIRPLPASAVAKCGGPGLCSTCKEEAASLLEAVRHLYNWQTYGGDNFHSLLFTLFQKGSGGNRERLGEGFPWEFEAWHQWQDAPSQNEYFHKFGLQTSHHPDRDHQ